MTDQSFSFHSLFSLENIEIISDILCSLGIAPKYYGHDLLIFAVLLNISKPDLIKHITKDFYPVICSAYNIPVSGVEGNIRFAIKAGWKEQCAHPSGIFRHIFEFSPYSPPSNTKFILAISDMVKPLLICN